MKMIGIRDGVHIDCERLELSPKRADWIAKNKITLNYKELIILNCRDQEFERLRKSGQMQENPAFDEFDVNVFQFPGMV